MLEELIQIMRDVNPDMEIGQVSGAPRLREDLGLNSLSMMLMAMEIEERFHIAFREDALFDTVEDICRYIQERTGVE